MTYADVAVADLLMRLRDDRDAVIKVLKND